MHNTKFGSQRLSFAGQQTLVSQPGHAHASSMSQQQLQAAGVAGVSGNPNAGGQAAPAPAPAPAPAAGAPVPMGAGAGGVGAGAAGYEQYDDGAYGDGGADYQPQSGRQQAGGAAGQPNWPTTSHVPGKAGVDPLERERREIERRRARFDDRRSRILQAKTRIIGVDKAGLDAQLKEKEDQRQRVEAEKQYFDQMTASHAQLLSEVERERQRVRSAKEEELAFYRRAQEQANKKKRADDRSAAMSNVPTHHPLDATAVTGKAPTVFLDFKGEDLGKAQREAEQKRQQQLWLEQQLTHQNDKQRAQRQDEADWAAQERAILEMKKQVEAEAQAARSTLRKETQTYNSVALQARKKSAAAQAAADAQLKAAEIEAQLQSQILNEKQDAEALRTNFKGFSAGQRAQIVGEQHRQISEVQAKRAADAQAEADWARMQDDMLRQMLRNDQLKMERERQNRQQLANTLQHQHREHSTHQRHLNKEVYTNPVAPAFFDQFGTSHR